MTQGEPQYSFRAVEVFVAVVEQGSITGAAKRLGLSQSTVSQQLSNLEASLGARLVERSARTFMLTSAGDIFFPRAQGILDAVSGATAALSGAEQAPQMTLRVAAIEDLDWRVMPAWLAAPSPELSNCRFALRSGASHENHTALADRSADLIVAVDAVEPVEWVETHPLLVDPFILVTAAELPATLAGLAERPMVRYAREQLLARQIEAQLRRTGGAPPMAVEVGTNQALLSMVAGLRGWAVTTAQAFLGTPGLSDRVVTAPVPMPAFARGLSLYARRGAFGDLPERCAADLRRVLEVEVIDRGREVLPFLGDALRLASE
ncbi:MAG: LysR family transcriptional regulator [Pseudomonadota bacterium]